MPDVRLVKDEHRYRVYVDDVYVGRVWYVDGDRLWASRVGNRHDRGRGNGWMCEPADVTRHLVWYPQRTRREAVARLIDKAAT